MTYEYCRNSGFAARGGEPARENPRDWLVWHFTHITNLSTMVTEQRLLPASKMQSNTNVANKEIKELRTQKQVTPDHHYPTATVSEHVPFYIAAKSPMLYVVCRGHGEYKEGPDPLVLLGVTLGDIVDAGATWCVSDGNAAATLTRFSRELSTLGEFIDFDLLRQRDWSNTPDDGDRKRRRSAEVLVLAQVPLELVTRVCCSNEATLELAKGHLELVSGMREYGVNPEMYY
ncbi:DUF4433 domain-containing protein [Nocardia sp. NPDC052566]|uniref:type II toxin-antitoxin system toxin DNA ADP-ribosyl transferase DarT n=1 Tax=Nocardia sp. NPDC052566 TaxID=3364330 RepID=UPI0037C5840C